MLHLLEGFEEYSLAERAREYIPLYLREGDAVVYVPYIDDKTRQRKSVKFVLLEGIGWVYADNSQGS